MRFVHQRSGDVGDDRRRSFRLRQRPAQGDAARPSHRGRVPPGRVDQQGERGSAKGPRGTDGPRRVLSLVLGSRIRAVPKEYPAGNFSGQSSGPRAATQEHRGGHVRPASVSVAGTAPEGRAGVGDVGVAGARRVDIRGDADAARGFTRESTRGRQRREAAGAGVAVRADRTCDVAGGCARGQVAVRAKARRFGER